MDDTVSRGSMDSLSTGEEYVVVNAEPRLKIAGNGDINDLEQKLSEVLSDDNSASAASSPATPKAANESQSTMPASEIDIVQNQGNVSNPRAGPRLRKRSQRSQSDVGAESSKSNNDSKSSTPGHRRSASSNSISSDSGHMQSLASPTSPIAGLPEETLLFTGVTYLGSATVNAPRSETEINRNMAVLNDQSQGAIPIILKVPSTSEGTVRMFDRATETEISSYRIHRILFCARGSVESSEKRCFAFTCSHGDSQETAIFQCHVFRCDVQEQVGKILYSFATAFRRLPKSPSTLSEASSINEDGTFRFGVTLEFREDDGKGYFATCPKDKNVFKLRANVEKKIVITVQQLTTNRELKIERCFGLLISPGRNVRHADMHLIDMEMHSGAGRKPDPKSKMVSMGNGADGRTYQISGHWDPCDPSFQILNTETPKEMRVFLTVAVDLVMEGIQEPVRFLIETKAKIFPMNERFWYFQKKPLHETFILKIKECEGPQTPTGPNGEPQYEVVSVESQTELDRHKSGLALSLSPSKIPPQNIQTPQDVEDESDGDEPMLSGSGMVSKDVTDEGLLETWAEVLTKWQANLPNRPRQVNSLVRKGVPEALRGEVWQLLACCHDNQEILEAYRILIAKESPNEQVILRDINRTFPAHDYFKESGGVGQDSLYKISKAYSVYDEEVGYCQGLSFLAASLLLHMPEEQAFCVLVKIMFDYRLRDLFKQGFEELHLKFYQLERLMQDHIGDLFEHFMELGLEAHMFASQWFLTLFTAKFPLCMVFHILDLFLCDGKDTIFNVALALLKTSRKDLLALDFEGVLKYFRVQLPKKYRNTENAHELLQVAVSTKISNKKLKKYEKEYQMIKEQEQEQEDPTERLMRENKRLVEANMRLEQENDDLAHELVSSKIALRNDLDTTEDKCEVLTKELLTVNTLLVDTEDEKKRLEQEAHQLKEMCRRELERSESESSRNTVIISDYKQICSQLSERLEKQQSFYKDELSRIKAAIQSCPHCQKHVGEDGQLKRVEAAQPDDVQLEPALAERDRQIRELELELAQTKLALVESECKTQDLTHQLNTALGEINATKNTWFQKTLTSLREATAKKEGTMTTNSNKETKEG